MYFRTPKLCTGIGVAAFLLLGAIITVVVVDFRSGETSPVPTDAKNCTQVLIKHTFVNQDSQPAKTNYTPPTDCGDIGSWAGITINLTVTSIGNLSDHLGNFRFNDVEIWRTSTHESTRGNEVMWTYLKDVTRYIPLFASEGQFVFDLGNLAQDGIDGQLDATVSATFYASSDEHPAAKKADLILPISGPASPASASQAVSPATSFNITFPKNTIEVYAEVFASGRGTDEFWYYNIANEYLDDIPGGTAYGNGSFREVRLLIDGMLAGVAFPYAVLSTGAIVPSAWRPIAAYGALEIPTYFLDLTPFVHILADGQPHNISIDVASAQPNHQINSNWLVSGLVQVITDPDSEEQTTGNMTLYQAEPFAETRISGNISPNGDVDVTLKANRILRIETTILSGSGRENKVVLSQNLTYANIQNYSQNATTQNVNQESKGSTLSTHNGNPVVTDQFSYPLNINYTILNADRTSWTASFDHTYERTLQPASFLLESTVHSHQLASGSYDSSPDANNRRNGTSESFFSYSDVEGNTFEREVSVVNGTITKDRQGGSLADFSMPPASKYGDAELVGGEQGSQENLAAELVRVPGPRLGTS